FLLIGLAEAEGAEPDDESGFSLRGGTSVGFLISAVPVVSEGDSEVEGEGPGVLVRAVAAALTRALRWRFFRAKARARSRARCLRISSSSSSLPPKECKMCIVKPMTTRYTPRSKTNAEGKETDPTSGISIVP